MECDTIWLVNQSADEEYRCAQNCLPATAGPSIGVASSAVCLSRVDMILDVQPEVERDPRDWKCKADQWEELAV